MKKRLIMMGSGLILTIALASMGSFKTADAAKKLRISKSTRPCEAVKYNSNTKNYYAIQTYLNKLKDKGGTLILKKGTYKIPGTVNVPSKVTIILSKGVVLKKTTKAGRGLKATKTMFRLSDKKAKKYKGKSSISFVGKSKSTIDLGGVSNAIGIDLAHNKNISVKGITFKGKKGGAYINVTGSQKVEISSNTFAKENVLSTDKYNAAVTISNAGAIPCYNVSVTSNKFSSLKNGIYTVYYRKNSYAEKIKIYKNSFYYMSNAAVCGKFWKNPTIKSNTVKGSSKTRTSAAVKLYTVKNPTISGNKISNCGYVAYISRASSVNNSINSSSISAMSKNTVSSLSHYYIPVRNASTTRVMYYKNKTDKNFTLSPATAPYREHYTDYSDYKANGGQAKTYFMLRSYMEQLEYTGGGTITLGPGVYQLSHSVCIPSNVTLKLAVGAEVRKVKAVNTNLATNKTMFEIVPPSKETVKSSVGGYAGSKNVTIEGETGSLINCDNVVNAMGVIMGHASNVTLRNLAFVNEYGSHFIELNSSKNVKVENCSFTDFKIYNNKSHKEAINVDSDDANNNGFNYEWAKHDLTCCDGVDINNCMFNNMGCAVGTHTYSYNTATASQCYHERVNITNCQISQTYNAAIRMLNWRDCKITGNLFTGIQGLNDNKNYNYTCILVKGAVNPTITDNKFEKGDLKKNYAVIINMLTQAPTSGAANAGYADTVCSLSAENIEALRNNTVGKNCYKRFITKNADGSTDLYGADGKKNPDNLFKYVENADEGETTVIDVETETDVTEE